MKEWRDTQPPEGQSGWREAVEITPDITHNREMLTTHSFDLEADPAEIVWSKRDLVVGERKSSLVASANADFELVVRTELGKEIDNYPSTQYDAAAIATAQTTYESRIDAINAASTHADIDSLE